MPPFLHILRKVWRNSDFAASVLRMPGGPYAGLELYLPADAMLFVATGYFNGIIQKAGEDHYDVVKRVAKTLWRRASRARVTPVGSSPGKLSGTDYSLAYAIMGEITEGVRFKFLVKTVISDENADDGIRAFLDLLRDIQFDAISEEDFKALLTYRPVSGTVLVTFDAQARKIVPVNGFEPPKAE